MDKTKIKSYEETYNVPMNSYVVTDIDGRNVKINTKRQSKHKSQNQLEQWPPVFHNIGWILQNADKIEPSKSNNPQAIANRKKGAIKIYKKINFIKELKLSGHSDDKDETHVIVLYDKRAKKNYSLTYSIYQR